MQSKTWRLSRAFCGSTRCPKTKLPSAHNVFTERIKERYDADFRPFPESATDGPVGQFVWVVDVVDHYVCSIAGGGDAVGLGFGLDDGLVGGT